jgi:pimeloyl-ACP methyl ester carboxylesterase
MSERLWQWRGQQISYTCTGEHGSPPGRAVLCVHGFGASKGHWRHNLEPLANTGTVYAIDLLGFGNSSKPISCLAGEPPMPGAVRYGFDLWGEQLADFCQEVIGQRADAGLQLIGNSIGGVVSLNAARLLEQRGCAATQVILIDCAERALDVKRLAEQPWPARITRPLLMGLVRQRWLIGSLFRLLAQPAFVRQVLHQAYPTGNNVDDALVDLLIQPSRQPGAAESFRGFVNLFNDWLAPQLLAQLSTPVRLLWGAADPWEPLAEAQRWATQFKSVQELHVLPGLGHCPHDESPEQVNPILLQWLDQGWSVTAEGGSSAV